MNKVGGISCTKLNRAAFFYNYPPAQQLHLVRSESARIRSVPVPSLLRLCVVTLVVLAGRAAIAQDSVASTPGGNDALSAYDLATQRVRYAVDLVPQMTSWSNPILVGPILKSSRDLGPAFRTQILGSLTASPSMLRNLTFPAKDFALWNSPGAGVHPSANSGGGVISASAFSAQFGVAISDLAQGPTNVVGVIVGREPGAFNRLLVERVVAASSRASSGSADTATLALGAIDGSGTIAFRADSFNTASGTTNKLLGDCIVRVSATARTQSMNTLSGGAGSNSATDAGATAFIISNEPVPTNAPTIVNQAGVGSFAMAYDFAYRFRVGSNTSNLTSTTSHLPIGMIGHRGNPSYMPAAPLGGTLGTVASIGITSGPVNPNRLIAFGLSAAIPAGTPPTVASGSPRVFTLPAPISAGSFIANTTGNAAFKQYYSQTSFRGGNGQVGIGTNAAGSLVLAAVATDPSAGNFIAVATAASAASQSWAIAAYPAMPVLSGANGATVGTLDAPALAISAPAVDRFGNVYFVAGWKPNALPESVGVFKAVSVGSSYKLELLLTTGQQITGANSASMYTVAALTLSDSDSVASGTICSGSIIQDRDPDAIGNSPLSIRAFGGLVVAATLSYNNMGTPEVYDAAFYIGPAQGIDCTADFNHDGTSTVQDIFDFLGAWFSGDPRADINGAAGITVQDIFDFLTAWFAGCP